MFYNEYFIAADKHLHFCQWIINKYPWSENKTKEQDYMLAEIYYLSGYIVEGLTVYSIYKLFGWEKNKNVMDFDEDFLKRSHFLFYKSYKGEKGEAKYFVKGHKFKEYKDALIPKVESHNIPYIGSNIAINKTIKNLLDEWEPGLRYKSVATDLTKDVAKELVDTCYRIYEAVIKNIGYDKN